MSRELLLHEIDESELRIIIHEEIVRAMSSLSERNTMKGSLASPDLFTLAEVQKLLRISAATLHRRMRENTIQTVRIGRRRLVSSEEITRLLGENIPTGTDGTCGTEPEMGS